MTHTYHVIDTYVLQGLAHTCQSSDTYVSFQASHIRIWNEVDSAFADISLNTIISKYEAVTVCADKHRTLI